MRLVRVAAAAVVGFGLLAGCSGGGSASETLPAPASSPAGTSAALPPLGPPDLPMPDEAREQTAAGAERFLRYYMDVYNEAQASMNPTYMEQLSQNCATCDRIIDEIKSDASAGYHYRGGQIAVDFLDATEPEPATVELVFSVTQAPLEILGEAGEPIPDLTFDERRSPGCGAILAWSPHATTWLLHQWDIN